MEKLIQEDGTVIATKEAEVEFDCKQVPLPSKGCDIVNRNGVIDKRVVKNFSEVLLANNEGHFSNCSPDVKFKAGGNSVIFRSDYAAKNNIDSSYDCCANDCCSSRVVNEHVVDARGITDYETSRKSQETPKEVNDIAIDEIRNYTDSASALLSTLVIKDNDQDKEITFVQYESEDQLPDLVALITVDLSEPYSVYTYRYFLHNWPHLSHLAYHGSQCVGAIVCKLDIHRKNILRGYIAMLVVHKSYRRWKIGSSLVKKAVRKMINHGCEEVVLETEVTNKAALKLYENLGFVRDKRLLRYYLNGVDAWRLKLWLK